MADRFRGWRGKAGVGAFVLAVIMAGAWAKSAIHPVVQNWTFGGEERPQSLSGKIGISYLRNPVDSPGHLPQTAWRVMGLYSDAEVLIAPVQVVATRPRTIPAYGAATAPVFFEEPGGPVSTSFWEWGGFCYASEAGNQGERCAVVLVPHWAVIVPLLLVSSGFFMWPRKLMPRPADALRPEAPSRNESSLSSMTTQRPSPRRRRLALTAVCLTGVAIVGWTRSSETGDRLRFLCGSSQMVEVASGREGLGLRQFPIETDESFRTQFPQYRKLTGEDYKSLTFRPLGSELLEAHLSGNPILEFDVEDEGFADVQPAAGFVMERDTARSHEVQLAGFEETGAEGASSDATGGRDWEGVSVDWFGAYLSVSRNPAGVTFVLPYWIVVMGLGLMTVVVWGGPASRVRDGSFDAGQAA